MDPKLKKLLGRYRLCAFWQSRAKRLCALVLLSAACILVRRAAFTYLMVGLALFWHFWLCGRLYTGVLGGLRALWEQDCDPALAAEGFRLLAERCRQPVERAYFQALRARALADCGQFAQADEVLLQIDWQKQPSHRHTSRQARELGDAVRLYRLDVLVDEAFLQRGPEHLWALREDVEGILPEGRAGELKSRLLNRLGLFVLLLEGDFLAARRQAQSALDRADCEADRVKAAFLLALAEWKADPAQAQEGLRYVKSQGGGLWCAAQAGRLLAGELPESAAALGAYPPESTPVKLPEQQERIGIWNIEKKK